MFFKKTMNVMVMMVVMCMYGIRVQFCLKRNVAQLQIFLLRLIDNENLK